MNLQLVNGGNVSRIRRRGKLIDQVLGFDHCEHELLVVLIGSAMVHLHKQLQDLHILLLMLLRLDLLVNYSLQYLDLVLQILVALLSIAKQFVIRQKLQMANALFNLDLLAEFEFLLYLALLDFENVLLGDLNTHLPGLINKIRELGILLICQRDIQLLCLYAPQFINKLQKLIAFYVPQAI